MKQKQETTWQKIKRYILNSLMILALALTVFTAVYATRFNKDDAFIGGYKPYVISSDSMAQLYLVPVKY